MMPCVDGSVPVAIVAWPGQVSVVRYGYAASVNHAPSSKMRRRPLVHLRAVLLHVLAAHLIHDDDDDELRGRRIGL